MISPHKGTRRAFMPRLAGWPRERRVQDVNAASELGPSVWQDLTSSDEAHSDRAGFGAISTLRFAAILAVIAGVVAIYIGHVYSTQDLLNGLEPVRRDNLALHLELNRLRGMLEEASGPAVIYRRAAELGLEEGGPYAATIRVGATP